MNVDPRSGLNHRWRHFLCNFFGTSQVFQNSICVQTRRQMRTVLGRARNQKCSCRLLLIFRWQSKPVKRLGKMITSFSPSFHGLVSAALTEQMMLLMMKWCSLSGLSALSTEEGIIILAVSSLSQTSPRWDECRVSSFRNSPGAPYKMLFRHQGAI